MPVKAWMNSSLRPRHDSHQLEGMRPEETPHGQAKWRREPGGEPDQPSDRIDADGDREPGTFQPLQLAVGALNSRRPVVMGVDPIAAAFNRPNGQPIWFARGSRLGGQRGVLDKVTGGQARI